MKNPVGYRRRDARGQYHLNPSALPLNPAEREPGGYDPGIPAYVASRAADGAERSEELILWRSTLARCHMATSQTKAQQYPLACGDDAEDRAVTESEVHPACHRQGYRWMESH